MSEQQHPSQLPSTDAIQPDNALQATTENWFEYSVRAHPHHTDYAGIVWHGCYLTWMEEARVEYLRSIGVDFSDLVALGCDLPVIELSVRYHRALRMGESAVVKTRMADIQGVRINWDYQIQSPKGESLYLTARVTLVAIDREKGKILRQLPSAVKDALIMSLRSN
ncbi:MAG: acyl-CoA thioesterase [Cyanobacteria bacterium SW_6_48_11]|nr:MAG: acyl-CoA thioesterase [Cyanobacteria bacterium QS_1_48_34]PSO80112.1 MAG: acyl-CoA thioesterase [Cyanobacteria bacterium QS_5_48_63]PSO86110.1 MAG: acyl-CoA thioesterase [Cyanobacteria bacterium QS_3_48_167]PSO92188.1 MAG: acyl-CoA thioesterase [Cyanobacteria bacterium SW_6_48_11]PSO92911.1 MAG: acyl-CoA thioesterase [Cyanobacteria bacterium QS_6_48_18]PSP07577.1 MAG: acyl-CoA thioesterase [Cyanobacteria bacterium SW_12_48_29]PSP09077.1 MAG: acyl-CoA thioesterase [Cyanobacteria bacter